jgi:hypothetical protein
MKKVITILSLFSLCFFLNIVIAQETDVDDKPIEDSISSGRNSEIKAFCEVIKENWEKWAGDKKEINKEKLIYGVSDASNKDESAAALVALIFHLKKEKISSIAYEDALESCKGKSNETYEKLVIKLRNMNRTLFANGKPTFSLMKQGPEGDCYFFSGAGWIAKYRNEVIIKAIKTLPGNKYFVKFPDGTEAEVTEPTDAEIAINYSASTLSDGLWMPVLEKALGEILKNKNEKLAKILDPTVRIDVGGGPGPDVKRWTGNDVKLFALNKKTNIEEVRESLIRMNKHNLMSQALVLKPKGKIIGDHVYAVMGFDSQTNMLTVWNPWGTDYKHKGIDCPQNGYNREQGIFKISLEDFLYLFSYLAIEKK